jgi:adenine-specific DNA methylase
VNYELGSADAINLEPESIDYVFTDPPFGSNIFYSDMNLFQEAWLETATDHEKEAVIDRSKGGDEERSADRYEQLITAALKEAHRVLKPAGWLSLVFSNSNGEMWALVQRALKSAQFVVEDVAILNKGQRSVKGLASGFENVVTVDLVLSMRKATPSERRREIALAPSDAIDKAVEVAVNGRIVTPSHVYVEAVREFLVKNWNVADLHVADIALALEQRGYQVDPQSGSLVVAEAA